MAESASIQKVSPRHEAILNYILANPTEKLGNVAGKFGVTPAWLSTIIHSEAFQDQLKRRQDELFDSAILQDLGGKLTAAAHMSIDAYLEKVPTMDTDQVIAGADKILGRLGYGSGGRGGTVIEGDVNIQTNHVAPDVMEKARERIGSHSVGEADSAAALPHKEPAKGAIVEGMAVRTERASMAD